MPETPLISQEERLLARVLAEPDRQLPPWENPRGDDRRSIQGWRSQLPTGYPLAGDARELVPGTTSRTDWLPPEVGRCGVSETMGRLAAARNAIFLAAL